MPKNGENQWNLETPGPLRDAFEQWRSDNLPGYARKVIAQIALFHFMRTVEPAAAMKIQREYLTWLAEANRAPLSAEEAGQIAGRVDRAERAQDKKSHRRKGGQSR